MIDHSDCYQNKRYHVPSISAYLISKLFHCLVDF